MTKHDDVRKIKLPPAVAVGGIDFGDGLDADWDAMYPKYGPARGTEPYDALDILEHIAGIVTDIMSMLNSPLTRVVPRPVLWAALGPKLYDVLVASGTVGHWAFEDLDEEVEVELSIEPSRRTWTRRQLAAFSMSLVRELFTDVSAICVEGKTVGDMRDKERSELSDVLGAEGALELLERLENEEDENDG